MTYLQLFNVELPALCLPQGATYLFNRPHQKTTCKIIPLTKTEEGTNQAWSSLCNGILSWGQILIIQLLPSEFSRVREQCSTSRGLLGWPFFKKQQLQ